MTHDSIPRNLTLDPGAIIGPMWVAGWLFTIGYAGLPLVKILLGVVLWPYFLGVALR